MLKIIFKVMPCDWWLFTFLLMNLPFYQICFCPGSREDVADMATSSDLTA